MNNQDILNLFLEVKCKILVEIEDYREENNYEKVVSMVKNTQLIIEPKKTSTNAYVELVDFIDYKFKIPVQNKKYLMYINETRFNEKDMENLMYHEFAHIIANTFMGCDQFHNQFYKILGESLGKPRSNFNATRPYPSYIDKENDFKYKVVCNNCGRLWYSKNKTNFIKNLENYRCFCGVKNFSLIELK